MSPLESIDPTIVMFGKLLLAAFLGFVIGTERAVLARHVAGSRTFSLVSLGACLFVLAGLTVDLQFLGKVNFDPARVMAAVIQGVGFLSAGLIIFKGDTLHGVTTAAGMWVATGIGVLVAFGMYALAFFATFLTLAIFVIVWFVEDRLKQWSYSYSTDSNSHSEH